MARGGIAYARGASARWRVAAVLALVLALLVTMAGTPASVAANTLTVLNGNNDGAGSLRATIAAAAPGDTIVFDPSVSTVTLTSGLPTLNKSLTIRGRGVGGVTIQRSTALGTPAFRIFTWTNGTAVPVAVTLEGLTLTNGRVTGGASAGGLYIFGVALQLRDSVIAGNVAEGADGGGFYQSFDASPSYYPTSATLTNSTIRNNSATSGGRGGGIYLGGGTLTLTNSTVHDNTAGNAGGGLYMASGTATLNGNTVVRDNDTTTGHGAGLFVNSGSLSLTDSAVNSNEAADDGGGIFNDNGTVTLTNSTVSLNQAVSNGAGIYSDAGMTLTSSTVKGNEAGGTGGGIYHFAGTATLANSVITGNGAIGSGGGIYNFGTLNVTNSTVSGNVALNTVGGGIFNEGGTTTLRFATVTNNSAANSNGGGVYNSAGTVTVTASVLVGNPSATGNDCASVGGSMTTGGYSVIGTGCPVTGSDLVYGGNLSTLRGPLANYGGFTETHLLLPGSPAIDRVPTNQCANANGVDQRGITRPQGSACDSGAFELRTLTLTTGTAGTGTGTVSPASGTYPEGGLINVSAIATGGSTFTGWTVNGNPAGSANPLVVPLFDHRTVIATFAAATVPLTVATSGDGSVARDTPGIGSGPFGYAVGTTVKLTAQPGAGQTFTGWTVGTEKKGWAPELTVTLDAARTVQATFTPTKTFADTGSSLPEYGAVVALATRGYILGLNAQEYGPGQGVQRAQMAALIARATPAGPDMPPATASCVVPGSWDCEDWGNSFQDRGGLIASLWRNAGTLQHYKVAFGYDGPACAKRGVPSPCYAPTAPVTHAETLAFITRALIAKGYWVAQPTAPVLAPGVPGVLATEAQTYAYYTGSLLAPPSGTGWNDGATRGWFARALWQALNSYWGTDGNLQDGRPAGGMVP